MEHKQQFHLTENYQLQAADKLISKLRQQNAANEEYIAEIEEKNSQLQQQIDQLKKQNTKILNKYSSDMKTLLQTDEIYLKYKMKIEELETEVSKYKNQRDQCLIELAKRNV